MSDLAVTWVADRKISFDRGAIEQHLDGLLRRLKTVDRVEIEISIITDEEIKKLKQRFFAINEPTDVLSFPYDGQIPDLLGTIVISVETAERQANSAGIEIIEELKMLASHGLLHLLGFHHK